MAALRVMSEVSPVGTGDRGGQGGVEASAPTGAGWGTAPANHKRKEDKVSEDIPGLIGKVAYFNTSDGLWWELGTIVEERYQMTADGQQWCFRLNNGAWLRDLRQNQNFRVLAPEIAHE